VSKTTPTQGDLSSVHPDETGGPNASNRLDFQKNWTIRLLVSRHSSPGDYVLICDYHDDVVVVEREASTGDLHFYQVKSRKTGTWTVSRLIARDKGKSGRLPSIVGKLYKHQIDFPTRVGSLTLVSNACFNVDLADGSKGEARDRIPFDDVHADARTKVLTAVKQEHALTDDPAFPSRTEFVVTPAHVAGHDDHAIGVLARFLEEVLGTTDPVSAVAAHRALFDEVRRRTNVEGTMHTLDDLVAKKGFTRKQFQDLLDRLRQTRDVRNEWPAIASELATGGMPLVRRKRIETQWNRYYIQRADHANDDLHSLRERVAVAIAAHLRQNVSLVGLIDGVVQQVGTHPAFAADYVAAMLLMELAANEHPAIQEAHTNAPNETS